jgi:plastocyanin
VGGIESFDSPLIRSCETAAVPVRRGLTIVFSGAFAVAAFTGCGGGGGKVQTMTVTGSEMRFDPAELTLAPGRYRFHFVNGGQTFHDLGIYRDGKSLGIREAGAGQSIDLDVIKLQTGTYTMECHEPGHLRAGMHGTITVRKPA